MNLKYYIVFVLMLCYVFITACNDDSGRTEVASASAPSSDDSTTNKVVDQKLYAFYITKDDYVTKIVPRLNGSGQGKLSFQFAIDPETNNNYTLAVWPYKGNSYHPNRPNDPMNPVIYLKCLVGKWPFELSNGEVLGGQKLGNQHLNVNTLFPGNNTLLVLRASRDLNGRICFKLSAFVNLQELLDSPNILKTSDSTFLKRVDLPFDTKPSPPASDGANHDS